MDTKKEFELLGYSHNTDEVIYEGKIVVICTTPSLPSDYNYKEAIGPFRNREMAELWSESHSDKPCVHEFADYMELKERW